MRYREKLNNLVPSTYRNWVIHTTPSLNKDEQVEFSTQQNYIAMLDVVTPDWRKLVAKGAILQNPMLSVTYLMDCTPLIHSCKLSSGATYGTYGSGFLSPKPFNAVSLDWDLWDEFILNSYWSQRDIALSKAWANVDISEMEALASLGELPETLHWMTSLMTRMISILRAFTQKRLLITAGKFFRSGTTVIDAMSELWLEFRYAVRPLLMDMDSAISAWNHVIDKSMRHTARGFHRTESTSSSTYVWDFRPTLFDTIVSRTHVESANYRAGVLFRLDPNLSEIATVWGLNQPLEAVWELIPFSFIIDWFFNVGTKLKALTANPSLLPLTSWITEEIITTVTDSANSAHQYGFKTASGYDVTESTVYSPSTCTVKRIVKRRLPTPSMSLSPVFKLNLDTGKLIDLAAIGRNLFSVLSRRS